MAQGESLGGLFPLTVHSAATARLVHSIPSLGFGMVFGVCVHGTDFQRRSENRKKAKSKYQLFLPN